MDVMEGMLKGAQEPAWLEKKVVGDLRTWQLIFLVFAGFLAVVIALCCCIRFRVPRTKQQIEADYRRRIITRKFRQELEKIQNSQMDSVDLKMALELIMADFKAEEKELEQQNASLMSSIISAHDSDICAEKPINRPFGKKLLAFAWLSKRAEDKKELA